MGSSGDGKRPEILTIENEIFDNFDILTDGYRLYFFRGEPCRNSGYVIMVACLIINYFGWDDDVRSGI